jgi:hydroxypyruvate reductase
MLTLVLSDVIGDPLDVIASGPTVPNSTTAQDALDVLERFVPEADKIPSSVRQYLRQKNAAQACDETTPFAHVSNIVIGNNQTAVDAARAHAESLGYRVIVLPTETNEGTAEEVAARLLDAAQNQPPGICILSGGEPIVRLVDSAHRGRGGRNQQLVLASVVELLSNSWSPSSPLAGRTTPTITLLSGGTDGEDGPTDAAGAILDTTLLQKVQSSNIDPRPYLMNNDAYTFFSRLESLLVTGPTNTNVCDLRVLIVGDVGYPLPSTNH